MNITARHANIKNLEFGPQFFKQFDMVMNALDNLGEHTDCTQNTSTHFHHVTWFVRLILDARRHVNRLCVACDLPLIESGTEGYLGQVQVIKRVCPSIFLKGVLHFIYFVTVAVCSPYFGECC